MLEIAQILLFKGERIAQDRSRILDSIALGQAGVGRFDCKEADRCDQCDQQSGKTLMGHGEARCWLDFGTAL